MADALHVGVDGCPGGWVAVFAEAGTLRLRLFPDFRALLAALPDTAILAVDMPVGLPDRIGPEGRGPERLARAGLAARQSSVFSIPARGAVEAGDYREACRIALETSDPPRKVSRQAFHLFPKIREIDAILRGNPTLCRRIFESHPEVAFWRLNGERAMRLPKKVRGRADPDGLAERRALLARWGVGGDVFREALPRGVGADDLLDAAVLSLVARRIAEGTARPMPDPPRKDGYGLPVAIWS